MATPACPFPYENFHESLTKQIQMLYNNLEFLGKHRVKEVECKNNHVKEKKKNQNDRCTQYHYDRSSHFYDQIGVLQAFSY